MYIGIICFDRIAVYCSGELYAGYYKKKIWNEFRDENDTFFPANDTDSEYYRRFVYKYKILEKRYGVGYFDSCIQLYYNGHISAYILGNKVFRAVILWK